MPIKNSPRARAFTLVELILVMALLTTIMAISAPVLARSLRGRHVKHEAARLVALTEYARNEAVSQGVPMAVWIDVATGAFGMRAQDGFAGSVARNKSYRLNPDLHFEATDAALNTKTTGTLGADVAEFSPDGTPDEMSAETLQISDRFGETLTVVRTRDRWGYEVSEVLNK